MAATVHLYQRGDRSRASLARDLAGAGFDVRAFALADELLAAARAEPPLAILWDIDADPADAALALDLPLVRLTRSRPLAERSPAPVLVLPSERWRVAPLLASHTGGPQAPVLPTLDVLAQATARGSAPRVLADTVRHTGPPAWFADELDALAAVAPSDPALRAAARPVSVLVADDDDVLQHILAYQLREAGWDVTSAADGLAAQDALDHRAFDLVLLDLNLPHRNGFELLEHLDLRRVTRAVQVVVMSEQAQDDKIIRAFSLGAHDFLQKPLNPQVALSRFRRLLERA